MSFIMIVLTLFSILWLFGAQFRDLFALFAGYVFAIGLIWLLWVGAVYFILVKPLVTFFA